nr:hypothetical protein EAVVTKC53_03785 [Elizabethkingia anophelis]
MGMFYQAILMIIRKLLLHHHFPRCSIPFMINCCTHWYPRKSQYRTCPRIPPEMIPRLRGNRSRLIIIPRIRFCPPIILNILHHRRHRQTLCTSPVHRNRTQHRSSIKHPRTSWWILIIIIHRQQSKVTNRICRTAVINSCSVLCKTRSTSLLIITTKMNHIALLSIPSRSTIQ